MAKRRKPKKLKKRNPTVVPARGRKAGPMEHRFAEKGGADNPERRWKSEWDEEPKKDSG